MQKAGSNKLQRVGIEEELIKFRPSPNFKNMKKFLKSKIDCSDSSNPSPPNVSTDPMSSPTIEEKETKEIDRDVDKKELKTVGGTKKEQRIQNEKDFSDDLIQPPLPLEQPPPESPDINLTLKKEIEDLEYDSNNAEENTDCVMQELITEFKEDKSEETIVKTKQPVCRDFLRGTCTRPRTCKFAHEFDVTQLVGVYTFCRNYQNSKCTYSPCKYVHASVFEEQEFYRTGLLPPNAFSHHKKVIQPPPPPPPEEPMALSIPIDFSNPPPPLPTSVDKLPMLNCMVTNNAELGVPAASGPDSKQVGRSPLKLWNELKEFSLAPRDLEHHDKLKKCANCEMTEYRLQYNKERVQQILDNTQEVTKKINQLNVKHQKLYTVLLELLKSSNKSGSNGMASIVNGDKEKMLEQLASYLNTYRINASNDRDDTKKFPGS